MCVNVPILTSPKLTTYFLGFLISWLSLLVKEQVALHEDLKIKYLEGVKERKELYNKVLELKGS